jgi:hypothetical protein
MSYINEQTTSIVDLLGKLDTFLSGTPGWTVDFSGAMQTAGEFGARKTPSGIDIGFAMQWDTGTPDNVGTYHFHGAAYNTGNAPYAQNDDSGNGAASTSNATLDTARRVEMTADPLQYWAFEDDHYFHVVVEAATGFYMHFGAGMMEKFGDWTGGEYVYASRQETNFSTDVGIKNGTTHLLDGLAADAGAPQPTAMEPYCATIHCESLPGQVAGGKYAVHMGLQGSGDLGNDRQSVPKGREHFTWGYRAGPYARLLSRFDGSDLSGHLPMYPIVSAYWRRGTNDLYGPMGYMKDVRGVSIRNYVPGQELTIGGDTWMIFPSYRKWVSGSHSNFSDHQAIAYKKVTT